MKHLTLTTAILTSALALSGCISIDTTDDGSSSSASSMAAASSESKNADMINVTSPRSNELVTSPLIIRGEARGNWYFEASFPVKLLDANGNELAAWYAQAQGEWMTTDFVPFESKLEFGRPSTPTGTLVLENDNPSGLPENSASISVPVRFR
jgi:hypothetical protein